MRIVRTCLLGLMAAAGFAAGVTATMAQPAAHADCPNRPVTFVIPFPPGGSTTIVVRSISDKLSEVLGQQIVIDNRAGAGGTVGTRALARSEPDGYTIGLGYSGTLAIGPHIYSNVGYDPRKDFAPIGRVGTAPNTLVAHPSFDVKSVKELVAYAKANPGKVNYGSAGVGTVSHVCGEYFGTASDIKLTHIPYKGTGPALADLVGGHIPMAFAPIPATAENSKAGRLRMLGVTSLKRSALMPDVPTIAEQGVTDFEAVLRYGIVAPAGTPPEVVARLNRAFAAALRRPELAKMLAQQGLEMAGGSDPENLRAFMAKEVVRWRDVVNSSGAQLD